ncbi:MAG: hypothetical protein HY776_07965, partial [Actinobacteria bacterium]|nr:hypothetical protein [Actinomycetota bacterium]
NMVSALRAACGVDLGAIPPSYASANGTIENTPKALLQFKNATTYSRPGVSRDKELFTAKNPDGSYKLKYNWSIDVLVGDGSRYADIVLPDRTHPERYDYVGGHWFAFTSLIKLRQPVITPLYEARQVRAILYELGNTAPLADTVPNGGGTPKVKDYFSYDPGVSTETWQTAGGNAAGNVRADGTPDGDAATVAWMKKQITGTVTPGATTADKWDYITTNGIYCTGGAPTYTKTDYSKSGWKTGSKAEVYNAVLGTKKWRPAISSDPFFSSTPVYASDGNGGYDPAYYSETGWFGNPATYTHQLTTYKLNVHDQANTNESPRLMEIIGKNWAVMGVSGVDGTGPYALASDGSKVYDGEIVKLTSLTGAGVWEAKVTYRAQTGCVHVSHHMGHDGSSQGNFVVDGKPDRDDANNVAWGSLVTKGAVNTSLAPSSPRGSDDPMVLGKTGTNVNYVIVPNRSCPIGASLSFYDTRVKVEKVI